MSVCIIGAGAAGLVSGKHFIDNKWNVKIFEKSNFIGGTWVYNSSSSSIYKNLTTNLSKHEMAFINYPFPKDYPSIMNHKQVLNYLLEYTKINSLENHILLNHKIISVKPYNINNPLQDKYIIRFLNNNNNTEYEEIFDYVIVCNGHYSKPYIPKFKGIEYFKGKIIHSKEYREPEIFKNKNILIIGNGASSKDISRELSSFASIIHICTRSKYNPISYQTNIHYHCNINNINELGEFILQDNSIINNIDILLYCTGYDFDLHFLDKSLHIDINYKQISDLFLHILPFNQYHSQYNTNQINENTIPPSLGFIGLPFGIIPFPLFDYQAQFLEKIWSNKSLLPSIKTIKQIIKYNKQLQKHNNIPSHYTHILIQGQYKYHQKLLYFIENNKDKENPFKEIEEEMNKKEEELSWYCTCL